VSNHSTSTIRLHRLERASRANGPGVRMVLWTQGCAFACPGCFNPETHDLRGGERWNVDDLMEVILSQHQQIQGLTLSGGEPLYQHRALAELLEKLRARTSLSVLVFTGYRWEELQRLTGIQRFLANVDVLLAGRYDASRRVASGLVGSSNKTVHFLTGRYTPKDLHEVPQAEVILMPDGEIRFSGIDPLTW
jgi:anaerobic ribonucleoside-triphosphate reductase activating protein